MIDFVGAGPGATDLITVRGMRLLSQADIIIYAGSLINPELLSYAKEDARIYNSAEMTLEQVLSVMREADRNGEHVVRLHTGDQSLYGAIREQMDALKESGIAFRSCPGVSACFGAAASLDLEFTLPGISQTLIITRAEGKTGVPEREKIADLASHHATMAIYLSAGHLEILQEELLKGGYESSTPAIIAYKATWPEEASYPCTVGTLYETGKRNNITKTALVLIGDVLLTNDYERSRLYDPSFSTGFREAETPQDQPESKIRRGS